MATTVFMDSQAKTIACLDYSVQDGHPFRFMLAGVEQYDVNIPTSAPGWQDRLAELAVRYGNNEDRGHGVDAWVYWLERQGKLKVEELQQPHRPRPCP